VYSLIPTIASIICTLVTLLPVSPLFVVILFTLLTVYVVVAYTMYQRILPLSAATANAQNKLSGVLSDAVTNILAVKTYGREDYERGLFDEADREAMDAERISMNAMMRRGAMTSTLITIIMFVTSIFVTGGNAWFGISAGTLVMMFSFTYQLSMRFNYVNSMLARMNRAVGDAAEMTKILDEPRLVEDAPNAPDLVVTKGTIDFSHLAFRYLDAAEDDYVFRDLDLHVPAGQRVGPRGTLGLRQDDAHQAPAAPLGRAGGAHPRGRTGHLRMHPAEPASAGRLRAAGGTALPPVHPREHRLRQAGRQRRGDSRGCEARERA
jgi:ATP-binding cassette subfamily B protein